MLKTLQAYRITVYVPEHAFNDYIQSIQDHIPSFGGDYDRVAWWSLASADPGIEQFRALDGASPTLGDTGQTVRTASVRLELTLPYARDVLNHFVSDVIIRHHPWEKPVITIQNIEIVV